MIVVVVVEVSQDVEWLPERSFDRQFWGQFHEYILFYALLLGIAHAVLYHGRYRERARAAERPPRPGSRRRTSPP